MQSSGKMLYLDLTTQDTLGFQDLLKPPSRSSSKNRKTTFADTIETSLERSDRVNADKLTEISNCQTPLSVSSQNIIGGDSLDPAMLSRGRKKTRTFFNTIKRKLSGWY